MHVSVFERVCTCVSHVPLSSVVSRETAIRVLVSLRVGREETYSPPLMDITSNVGINTTALSSSFAHLKEQLAGWRTH